MQTAETAWGLDIGHSALKAVKLRDAEGKAQAQDARMIEYPAVLSRSEANRAEVIGQAVGEFLDSADLAGSRVVLSVPSPRNIAKFVRLPPVDSDTILDVVAYEARQQIYYAIDEAVWRWWAFGMIPDSEKAQVDVGLFALERGEVEEILRPFREADVVIDIVQMRPLALHSLLSAGGKAAGATLLADLGAETIEMMVIEGRRFWAHTVEFGASRLTEALAGSLNVSFGVAEKLKREPKDAEAAEQISQGTEMAVNELALEFRRCVDNYHAIPGAAKIRQVLAVGRGFLLPGLCEAIEWCVEVQVARLDAYDAIAGDAALAGPPGAFAVACGLALQGLGRAAIDVNFLPSGQAGLEDGAVPATGTAVRRFADRLLGRFGHRRP